MASREEMQQLLKSACSDDRRVAEKASFELRRLLRSSDAVAALTFLVTEIPKVEAAKRGCLAFPLAEYYLKQGRQAELESLVNDPDAAIRESAFNALWGTAPAEMGPAIVAWVSRGITDPAPEVRAESCRVVQNQSANGVDVTTVVPQVIASLSDRNADVRSAAAYAVGNLAKKKYPVAAALTQLRRNLKHRHQQVRGSSAWAIWQMSRYRTDIGKAIGDLLRMMSRPDEGGYYIQHAAGAVLHHARKSAENADQVQTLVEPIAWDRNVPELSRFLEKLAAID